MQKDNHFVINDANKLRDFNDVLYICGGASIYKIFMQNDAPDVIVDSCYKGELNPQLTGNPVDITTCIEAMKKNYEKISKDYDEDNIITTVWTKKGTTVKEEILTHIISSIINK